MSLMHIQDVGKAYLTFRSEWQRLARWVGVPCQPKTAHWVLRHIHFDVAPGEAIGIVGQNGAGKSTLLKMITGTQPPSEGTIQVNGRIAAILELGMGFNFELTARQNAYFSLGLMGFSRQEIERVLPDIAQFAEIGPYFEMPMRTYSSGMQIRVAFAVATAFRPEILIIDEALSVGDAYFQHKSLNRIREFQAQGTTLLIVSHDRALIQSLCHRALLLYQGSLYKDGAPEEVFDYYNALIAEKETATIATQSLGSSKTQVRSGTGEAKIKQVGLYNTNGRLIDCVQVGERVELRVEIATDDFIPTLVLGYAIRDKLGQLMYGTNTWYTGQVLNEVAKGSNLTASIVFPAYLGVGSYSVVLALTDSMTHLTKNYEWIDFALVFEVVNVNKLTFEGTCWIEPEIKITHHEPSLLSRI